MKYYLAPLSRFVLFVAYLFLLIPIIYDLPKFFSLSELLRTGMLFLVFLITVIWRGMNNLEALSPLNEDEFKGPEWRNPKSFSKARWTIPILWIGTLGMLILTWDGIGNDFSSQPVITWSILILFFGTMWYRGAHELPPFTLSSL